MSMKRISAYIAPLGVAFALLLAGTVPAFAVWGDSTYADWDDISALAGNLPVGSSPHGEYQTTSQKCKVCHAVHNANPGGQALLMSTMADSCSYCHVSAKVSNYVVYDGKTVNYSGTDFQNAHNSYSVSGEEQGVRCTDCHQVHAAYNKMTLNEYLTDKILSGPAVYNSGNYDPLAGAPQPLATDDAETAISKWCTRCHLRDYNYYSDGEYFPGLATHVMKAPSSNYQSVQPESSIAAAVAYNGSENCSSCHGSQRYDGLHAWPHYTSGARFLLVAASSAVASSGAAPGETRHDKVCLRCHRNGAGLGVGLSW